jgi:hypothetical protein
MNDHLNRYRTLGILAVLAVSSTLFLAALGPGVAGQPGQSPVSPVPAGGWPPALRPDSWLNRILDASFWTSPLPWAAIGLILFSALAGWLVRNLRRARVVEAEREEHSLPPEWTP